MFHAFLYATDPEYSNSPDKALYASDFRVKFAKKVEEWLKTDSAKDFRGFFDDTNTPEKFIADLKNPKEWSGHHTWYLLGLFHETHIVIFSKHEANTYRAYCGSADLDAELKYDKVIFIINIDDQHFEPIIHRTRIDDPNNDGQYIVNGIFTRQEHAALIEKVAAHIRDTCTERTRARDAINASSTMGELLKRLDYKGLDYKNAYRKLSLLVHPDKCSVPDQSACNQAFKKLTQLHDQVSSIVAIPGEPNVVIPGELNVTPGALNVVIPGELNVIPGEPNVITPGEPNASKIEIGCDPRATPQQPGKATAWIKLNNKFISKRLGTRWVSVMYDADGGFAGVRRYYDNEVSTEIVSAIGTKTRKSKASQQSSARLALHPPLGSEQGEQGSAPQGAAQGSTTMALPPSSTPASVAQALQLGSEPEQAETVVTILPQDKQLYYNNKVLEYREKLGYFKTWVGNLLTQTKQILENDPNNEGLKSNVDTLTDIENQIKKMINDKMSRASVMSATSTDDHENEIKSLQTVLDKLMLRVYHVQNSDAMKRHIQFSTEDEYNQLTNDDARTDYLRNLFRVNLAQDAPALEVVSPPAVPASTSQNQLFNPDADEVPRKDSAAKDAPKSVSPLPLPSPSSAQGAALPLPPPSSAPGDAQSAPAQSKEALFAAQFEL